MTSPFTPFVLIPPQWSGWQQLLQAYHCAGPDPDAVWQMSVEVTALKEAGLTHTDIRWLVRQGFAELAEETTDPNDDTRQLRPIHSLTLGPRTSVALTPTGAARLEHHLASCQHALAEAHGLRPFAATSPFAAASPSQSPANPLSGYQAVEKRGLAPARVDFPGDPGASAGACPPFSTRGDAPPAGFPVPFAFPTATNSPPPASPQSASAPLPNPLTAPAAAAQPAPAPPPKPHWDPARHELRLGDTVVKHFRRPAPTMELILAAFEEEGWPSVINDPLPGGKSGNPQRRLHHAVRNLNKMQSPKRIHFHVNGKGEEIHWMLEGELRANCARKARGTR